MKKVWLAIVLASTILTIFQANSFSQEPSEKEKWVKIQSPGFDRHLGLLLKSPDVGSKKTVFSYCELVDDNYAIYDLNGIRLTPQMQQNFYNPDLAANDSTLLVETIVDGEPQIWISVSRFEGGISSVPQFLTAGESPKWRPEGNEIVLVKNGGIWTFLLDTQTETQITNTGNCADPAFSENGEKLIFVRFKKNTTSLHIHDFRSETETQILQTDARIETPVWVSEHQIVYVSDESGNRDLWTLNLDFGQKMQLTKNPAADSAPTWDAKNQRLIFCSDRGRGLEFSALYEFPFSTK